MTTETTLTALAPTEAESTSLPYWQLACGSILISFSAVFVRLTDTGPTIDGFYRMFIGGIVLLALSLYKRHQLWAGWPSFLILSMSGIFLATDLIFWHRSIVIVGPGLATVLGNFQVFVLVFVGITLYKEKVKPLFYAAIPLVLIGMYCLVGVKWQEVGAEYQLGVYYGLATAIFYGLCVITLRKSQSLPAKLHAMPNLALLSLVSAVYLAIVAQAQGQSFMIPDLRNGIYLLCYGLFAQCIGWLLITKALPKINLSVAGFLILLQPSLSFVWDILLFQRPTPVIEMVGAGITLFAIYLSLVSRKA